MKNYIVFESDTGIIIRTGMCADTDIELQAMAGQNVIEHPVINDSLYRIDLVTLLPVLLEE